MLTRKRRWRGSIYSLRGEGVHGTRPRCDARRQGGRMSGPSRDAGCSDWLAGCPGWSGQFFCSLDRRDRMSGQRGRMSGGSGRAGCLRRGAGCPDCRGRSQMHSVMEAGFPVVGPDVRAGPDVRDMAGCPAVVAADSFSFSFLRSRAHSALVLGLSMVSLGVPEYAQGPRLK